MCDHIKTVLLPDFKKKCLDCNQQFCTHPKMDYDSTCMMCGEYIIEVSIEQSWCDPSFNKTNTVVKNNKDHIKFLEGIGYSNDIIEATMEKFTKIGCSLSEEPAVIAACVWMTYWDIGNPRTLIEIGKKHGITKSKIKQGRNIALSLEFFKEYKTKYITVSMMIRKLLIDLKIDEKYYKHIYDMAKFVENNWEKSKATRRSAPQNIASACVFLYIQQSPTLYHMIDTPTKKKELCAVMGPSAITIDKIVKTLLEYFINCKIK